MKKIIILCVMICLCHIVTAQNKISGRVTDSKGLPLPGASIVLPEINKCTVSDSTGSYNLTGIPDGKIIIRYSFVGYENRMETLFLNGKEHRLDITLKPAVIEAEEIVVTGGYHSSQHENAVKIDALSPSPAECKITPNFTEVLTRIPGIDMISKGSGVSKPVIRGLSMNDILVLNNGVRFENYQYSNHHPLGIDEFGIEEVEIIKGPASLLYGSDAIGGVVNFIKERPAPVGTISGDYNLQLFSNTLGMSNNIGIKGSSKNFFGGIRAGQKTNADFIQGGGGFVPNSRFNEYSVKANAGYTGNIGSFRLYYDHSQQNLGLVEEEAINSIDSRGRSNRIYYQQLSTDMVSMQDRLYLGKLRFDLNSAYQNTGLIHFGEANMVEIEMDLATLTYEAKIYLPSDEKSEYIAGFQGMDQRNSNRNNRETILLPDATTDNYSGFCLLQHTFFKVLKLQTGIRYDYKTISSSPVGLPDAEVYRPAISKNYGSFSGSMGATCHVSVDLLFRGNIASAYRTPNLAELTSNGQHENRFEIGNQNLVPENSCESDLSMHYHRRNVVIDVAGFYNVIDHYIYISPTGKLNSSGIPVYRYLQNNSVLYGGEAGIHIHPKNIEWLHLETTFSSVIGKQHDGDYLPFVPAHKLYLEIRGEKRNFLFVNHAFISVDSSTAFDQNKVAPDETPTNGYTLFDLKIGGNCKFSGQEIFTGFSVTNLFDKKYIDHLSTLKETGMYNPGRNFAFTLKVPF